MPPQEAVFYMFDLISQLKNEIDEFSKDITIATLGNEELSMAKFRKTTRGYTFNQLKTLNLIDLYYNSKFETGELDSEGQRKLFMNNCAFRSDVASKMIDLDVKDFIFLPEDSNEWGAYLLSRDFKLWAKQNYFGELINEIVEYLPKYGTAVIKKVGSKLQRVPLKNLICQQDAKDLKSARYVIEVHTNKTFDDLKEMIEWDTSKLSLGYDEKVTIYERYGRVPVATLKEFNGEKSTEEDWKKTVDVMAIISMQEIERPGRKKDKDYQILFMEKISSRPYEEVHWKKQDGRWLGIGEVENLFENQIATNTIANIRRRALLWSSKKIFQSPDDSIVKNLIKEVKDGDIIRIAPNGNITQVDMTTHSVAEFNTTQEGWEQNASQKSFTYEVATGESLPSGTPFRLGVLLSNAVNSHFELKREKLGLFFKRIVLEFLIPIFKKKMKGQHLLLIPANDEEFDALKEINIDANFRNTIFNHLKKNMFLPSNFVTLKDEIRTELEKKNNILVDIPDEYYDDIKYRIELEITGEAVNLPKKIETLTNLYQVMIQKGDPRADKVLDKLIALTGERIPKAMPTMPQGMPQGTPPAISQSIPGMPTLPVKEQPTTL